MHDLTIDKVAFVDSPANEREFLIFKSQDKENSSMPLKEALKKQLLDEGLSQDEIGEIEKATADGPWWKRLLSKNEKSEEELKKEVADKKKDEEKALALKKEEEDKTDAITKAASALVATELADLKKQATASVEREKGLKEEIGKEREIRKSAEYITKATHYTAVPLAKDELATFMRFVEEGSKPQFVVLEKMLDTVQAVFQKSRAFLADSALGMDETVGSKPDQKLEKMVDEVIAKAATGGKEVSRDAAMGIVIAKNPELYDEHRSQFIAGPSAADQSK